jgi:hypothetical protein
MSGPWIACPPPEPLENGYYWAWLPESESMLVAAISGGIYFDPLRPAGVRVEELEESVWLQGPMAAPAKPSVHEMLTLVPRPAR